MTLADELFELYDLVNNDNKLLQDIDMLVQQTHAHNDVDIT